ncbi:MAG: hypothetical protein ACU0CO_07825 [Shimia sp.]
MNQPQTGGNCTLSTFVMASVIGLLGIVVFRVFAGLSWPGAIFLGVILGTVLGLIFVSIFCRDLPSLDQVKVPGTAGADEGTEDTPAAPSAQGASAAPLSAPAAATAPAATPDPVTPSAAPTPAPAVAPEAAPATPASVAPAAPAPDPAPEIAPASSPEPEPTPEPAPTPTPAPETAAEAAAEAAPVADAGAGTKPATLDGPRGGKADDLKEIKGVGPKMEQLCNRLGFYHFDQIAAWTPDEVAWVDRNLEGFKGRVSRDNWVDQAKVLASGEETDFSKRVQGGDVSY